MAFPGICKIAGIISPIPKVVNLSQLKNYRPILILPILSKIYEKLILQQITEFIEKQFICHQSTTTFLRKLYNNIEAFMNKSEITEFIEKQLICHQSTTTFLRKLYNNIKAFMNKS